MTGKTMFNRCILATTVLSLIWIGAGVSNAADKETSKSEKRVPLSREQGYFEEQQYKPALRVSMLLGHEVQNGKDEKIGKINDLVIETGGHHIVYGVLSSGGVLGIADKLFAVPWQVYDVQQIEKADHQREYKLVLAIGKDDLKQREGFDQSHWPATADSSFATNKMTIPTITDKFADENESGRDEKLPAHRVRAGEVIGTDVRNHQDVKLGSIKDLVVLNRGGRIAYAVIALDSSLGGLTEQTLVAVPYRSLDWRDKGAIATLEASKDQMKSHSFKSNDWPDMTSEDWQRRTIEAFGGGGQASAEPR